MMTPSQWKKSSSFHRWLIFYIIGVPFMHLYHQQNKRWVGVAIINALYWIWERVLFFHIDNDLISNHLVFYGTPSIKRYIVAMKWRCSQIVLQHTRMLFCNARDDFVDLLYLLWLFKWYRIIINLNPCLFETK